MDDAGKDYLIQIKVKNGPLMRAIRNAGFKTGHAFADAHKISSTSVGDYLNLKKTPLNLWGQWRRDLIRIADALKMTPDMLFPEQHLTQALSINTAEVEASGDDVLAIMDWGQAGIDNHTPEQSMIENQSATALRVVMQEYLMPRQERVLRMRNGIDCNEMTLDEVGADIGASRERVRQIEAKALRKLKHPNVEKKLRAALEALRH